ncbi:hypothetical protein [Microbaculum marinum]|uniref:Surface antigen domain-containing protein n=1 Tax=Microbaculum marinum TaxID=1764581 RepID=A0AAW9RHG0_9HYPH
MHLTKLAAIAVLGASLSACDSGRSTPGPGAAAAGAGIGTQAGGRPEAGRGTVAGGLIGNRIGAAVDAEARSRAMEAEYQALQYGPAGSPVVWRDPDDNVYGEVIPGETYSRGGTACRDYSHAIYIDGRQDAASGTACRQPDGSWLAES